MPKLDLNRTSGLVSEGTHTFKITASKEQLSGTGNEMYVLTATCQDAGEDQGRTITMFVSLTPQARFKVDALLDAIGAPRKGEWSCEKFVGSTFRGVVTTGQFEGTERSEINRYLAPGAQAPQKPALSGGNTGIPADASKPGKVTFSG
jgi:hypothetical protein